VEGAKKNVEGAKGKKDRFVLSSVSHVYDYVNARVYALMSLCPLSATALNFVTVRPNAAESDARLCAKG